VRVTHLPTGLVAESHTERSRARNFAGAMRVLRGLVWLHGHGGVPAEPPRVRNYVLYPYLLVTDHLTGLEREDVGAVLDGDLDAFLRARLGATR
jgi:peptide chain release factor 2